MSDHRGLKKSDFKSIQSVDRFSESTTVRDRPIEIADNYLIFERNVRLTQVLQRAAIVATHSKGRPSEEWENDPFRQSVCRLTIDTRRQKSWLPSRRSPNEVYSALLR